MAAFGVHLRARGRGFWSAMTCHRFLLALPNRPDGVARVESRHRCIGSIRSTVAGRRLFLSVRGFTMYARSPIGVWIAALCVTVGAGHRLGAESPVDFNRDIRPLLGRHCLHCHGRDEASREGGLRLDLRDAVLEAAESGELPLIPGDPAASQIWLRISSQDDDERMPPAEAGPRLADAELNLFRRWIEEGATYAEHWSLVPPQRPEIPLIADSAWSNHPIDAFVSQVLDARQLPPNPPADPYELLRRVSLDLRGLPPSPTEVQEYAADPSAAMYERMVDRFLADPAFGERWARVWLDLARYADSRGYGSDPLRTNMWRYRDWVIDAFNRNLPYDQFTIDQLAGDLLPDPSLEQRMATAFHRNTMTNTEGGTDDEEFRIEAVKDRVDTTIQVWMGLTMGCAKCHDHKYDPLTQRDYYRLFAVFNQTQDKDLPDESPTLEAPRPEDITALEQHTQQVTELEKRLADLQAAVASAPAGAAAHSMGRWVRIELPGTAKILSLAEVEVFRGDENVARRGKATQSSTDYEGPPELAIDGNTNGDFFAAKSTTHTRQEDNPWWEVELSDEGPFDRIVIWNRMDGGSHVRLAGFRVQLLSSDRKTVWETQSSEPPNPELALSPRPLTPEEQQRLDVERQLSDLRAARPAVPTLPVMVELPAEQRRESFVLVKGSFLSRGERVDAAVPVSFHPLPEGAAVDRLALAHWLLDPRNPLTARVAVNRFWAQLFGTGLVATEEDFGTQGEAPSHPELLDWLACEFRDQNWDMKRLLRLLVTSQTYQQSSRVRPDHLERDPQNRWLARGPRVRLEAEMVRDQALALSGLLSRRVGGPSVYPYQPPGLWRAAFNGERTWPTSEGEDRFRRGLYVFLRRTVPYPSLVTFDAPSREVCTVRRVRTNTPLQALVVLNDPVYVEASQALARRLVSEAGPTPADRAAYGLQLCLCRPAEPAQVKVLTQLFDSELAHYRQDAAAAEAMASQPLGSLPLGSLPLGSQANGLEMAELAAWTVVSNVLLNLDGVLNK